MNLPKNIFKKHQMMYDIDTIPVPEDIIYKFGNEKLNNANKIKGKLNSEEIK